MTPGGHSRVSVCAHHAPALDRASGVGKTALVDHATESPESACPPHVLEFAEQAVRYVQAALTVQLGYDSETLPVMDHYLRSVPEDDVATAALVVSTAGAYFGEVVRRRMGGRWDISDEEQPVSWRVLLPTGLSFAPAGVVASVIVRHDALEDLETGFDVPPRLEPVVEAALARMGEVTEDEYYSLCGRLDTLEHLDAVLQAVEAERRTNSTAKPPTEPTDGN